MMRGSSERLIERRAGQLRGVEHCYGVSTACAARGGAYASVGVALEPAWTALRIGSACTTFETMLFFSTYAARASRLRRSASLSCGPAAAASMTGSKAGLDNSPSSRDPLATLSYHCLRDNESFLELHFSQLIVEIQDLKFLRGKWHLIA